MKVQKVRKFVLYCCCYESCQREYKSKFTLKKHVLHNHIGYKPFNCIQCGKFFVSKQNLIEHQFIHDDTKPYTCILCGESFRQASRLAVHRRVHDSRYQNTLNNEDQQ